MDSASSSPSMSGRTRTRATRPSSTERSFSRLFARTGFAISSWATRWAADPAGMSTMTRRVMRCTARWPGGRASAQQSIAYSTARGIIGWRSCAARPIRTTATADLLVGKVLTDRGAELRHILRDGTVAVEHEVNIAPGDTPMLFGDNATPWRSTRSVSRRRRLSGSSTG